MKRMLSRLVPLLLPACMVDTPVVEGPDDRLGEDLAAWCESTCDKWIGCGLDVEANCPLGCSSYMTEAFVGHGEACSNAGLRAMDCLEQIACPELLKEDPCNLLAEETRCKEPEGVVCQAESEGSGGSGGASCFFGYSDCSDGKEYGILCGGPDVPPRCDCLVNDVSTGHFALSESGCPDSNEVSRICGWPILAQGHRATRIQCEVTGSTGVAGGAGVNQCGISFGACSDGSQYGIECSGPPGAVVCTCDVDGASFGSFQSGAGICDFADSEDSGAAMANYTCGYSLAPIRFE